MVINFKAERDLREAAHSVARQMGMSLSALIRHQLRSAIAEHGTEPPTACLRDRRGYSRSGVRAHG